MLKKKKKLTLDIFFYQWLKLHMYHKWLSDCNSNDRWMTSTRNYVLHIAKQA